LFWRPAKDIGLQPNPQILDQGGSNWQWHCTLLQYGIIYERKKWYSSGPTLEGIYTLRMVVRL